MVLLANSPMSSDGKLAESYKQQTGISISHTTVARLLAHVAPAVRLIVKPALTMETMGLRKEFCHKVLHNGLYPFSIEDIVWLDEKLFLACTYQKSCSLLVP